MNIVFSSKKYFTVFKRENLWNGKLFCLREAEKDSILVSSGSAHSQLDEKNGVKVSVDMQIYL